MEFDLLMVCLLILLIVTFFWQNIFITIYPGERGVLFSRFFGTKLTKVYSEGLQVIFPWDKMYSYDVRLHERDLFVPVLATNGLTIDVQVAVHFRPNIDELPALHSQVEIDYETKIVLPVVSSSVREVIGSARTHDIYGTNQQQLQNQILQEIHREGAYTFIDFENILIQSIRLPKVINAAIDQKATAEQEMLRYDYLIASAKKEVARKKIEATGIARFQTLIDTSITPEILTWRGIAATEELA
ncbi:MAG: prohibitin family protein, partial [Candidatus Lindowbacteria bacterium]|nr:prohibitin family protein [Candidatus Lindowbacteria bacterium]